MKRLYYDIDFIKAPPGHNEMLAMLFNARCWTMLGMNVTKYVRTWRDESIQATVVEWE